MTILITLSNGMESNSPGEVMNDEDLGLKDIQEMVCINQKMYYYDINIGQSIIMIIIHILVMTYHCNYINVIADRF